MAATLRLVESVDFSHQIEVCDELVFPGHDVGPSIDRLNQLMDSPPFAKTGHNNWASLEPYIDPYLAQLKRMRSLPPLSVVVCKLKKRLHYDELSAAFSKFTIFPDQTILWQHLVLAVHQGLLGDTSSTYVARFAHPEGIKEAILDFDYDGCIASERLAGSCEDAGTNYLFFKKAA